MPAWNTGRSAPMTRPCEIRRFPLSRRLTFSASSGSCCSSAPILSPGLHGGGVQTSPPASLRIGYADVRPLFDRYGLPKRKARPRGPGSSTICSRQSTHKINCCYALPSVQKGTWNRPLGSPRSTPREGNPHLGREAPQHRPHIVPLNLGAGVGLVDASGHPEGARKRGEQFCTDVDRSTCLALETGEALYRSNSR
jgi:hypothetical protein